jgi:hypothetical protein
MTGKERKDGREEEGKELERARRNEIRNTLKREGQKENKWIKKQKKKRKKEERI